jgi:hypothetical protein
MSQDRYLSQADQGKIYFQHMGKEVYFRHIAFTHLKIAASAGLRWSRVEAATGAARAAKLTGRNGVEHRDQYA